MAGSSIAVRNSWFVRLLQRAGLVGIDSDGRVEHSAGADWATNSPAKPLYDPKTSLSAMAAFPWVYASVTALSTDLSKVPLKAYRGEGADAEVLDGHPMLDLLMRPSSKVPGILLRRQLATDLVLTGDAFLLIAGGSEPAALIRMHPSRVTIIPESDGQISHYEYAAGQAPEVLTVDQVIHIRSPSWSDDPSSLWGVGAIQCLNNDLMTEKSTAELTASTAKTGRPTGILSPSEDGDRWSAGQIKVLREAYERQLSQESGVLIVGGQVEYEPISLTPRDMEFSEVRNATREAVLAALDVPPTRVGLPSANYATSKEQARRYWEGLSGRAAMIDAELTRVARMFPNSENVHIKHDFSEIDALQESRTERVDRVVDWVTMGVGLADAAAYEGFSDLPMSTSDDTAPEMDDQPEDTDTTVESGDDPLASTALNGAQIASLLNIVAAVGSGAISFDAAMTLVLVAFPTVTEEQARDILLGAGQAPEGPADGPPEPPPNEEPDPDDEVEEEPEERMRAVGDEDPTNFPADGDDEKVSLRNSQWRTFDPAFAEMIKREYPSIWRKGGNTRGNSQYTKLKPIAAKGGKVETRAEEAAVRLREAWGSRHYDNNRINGVIAQVKWLVVGRLGESGMKSLIRKEMAKVDDKKQYKGLSSVLGVDVQDKQATDVIWRNFVDQQQAPLERAIQHAMRRYLKGYAARVSAKLPKMMPKKAVGADFVAKATTDQWILELLDSVAERARVEDVLSPVLESSLEDVFVAAMRDMPSGFEPVDVDRDWIQYTTRTQIADLVTNIEGETRRAVQEKIAKGLEEGLSVNAIQASLMSSRAFSAGRALRIARTESTKAVNQAGIHAWESASTDDAQVEFVWLTAGDEHVRDSHKRLNGKVRGPDGKWRIGTDTAEYPGGFSSAANSVNCRCTYLPRVK